MDSEIDQNAIEADYKNNLTRLQSLETEIRHTIAQATRQEDLKYTTLEGRVKTIESVVDKAKRKSISDPMLELNDIVGVRIIVLLKSHIKLFESLIKSEFDVIEIDNKDHNSDGLGYRSEHFVCKLKDDLKGRRYNNIKDLKFEIQLRTLCMHSWAALSHYLQYKSETDVPRELQQSLNALSGLFFVADAQFEQFFKNKNEYVRNIENTSTIADAGAAELNFDTLNSYIKRRFPDRLSTVDNSSISELISELKLFNIKTINDIDALLERQSKNFAKHEAFNGPAVGGRFNGVGVVRISFKLDNLGYKAYLKKNSNKKPRETRSIDL